MPFPVRSNYVARCCLLVAVGLAACSAQVAINKHDQLIRIGATCLLPPDAPLTLTADDHPFRINIASCTNPKGCTCDDASLRVTFETNFRDCLVPIDVVAGTGETLPPSDTNFQYMFRVQDVCVTFCSLLLPAPRDDAQHRCPDGSKKLLRCTNLPPETGINDLPPSVWRDSGLCDYPLPPVTCASSTYRTDVLHILKTASGDNHAEEFTRKLSVRMRAAEATLEARVCPERPDPYVPTDNRLLNVYAMHVLAFSTKMEQLEGYDHVDPCAWPGVTCDGEGRGVEAIVMEHQNLRGSLPHEIGRLAGLKRLSLNQNYIGGPVPQTIHQLEHLQRLDLDHNALTGTLPDIYSLTSLRWLDLDNNDLVGTIDYNIRKLPLLEMVSLWNNKFHGEVPESFGQLENLAALYLDGNNFEGECSRSLCGNRDKLLRHLSVDCNTVICNCATKCY